MQACQSSYVQLYNEKGGVQPAVQPRGWGWELRPEVDAFPTAHNPGVL